MASLAAPSRSPYAALAHIPFRWFVTSHVTTAVGVQFQLAVVGWQLYQLTRNPLSLGLLGLSEVLPYLAVALYAGHIVDRHDRRLVAISAVATLLAAAVGLMIITVMIPGATWLYYGVFSFCGVARSFLQTSRSALVAEMVPRAALPNAAMWRSFTWQGGLAIGGLTGGLLLAAFGVRAALVVNVGFTLLSLLAMRQVRHTPTPRTPMSGPLARSLLEGIRYLRRERVILGALTLDLVAVLFGGAVALLPIFATDVLQVGPRGFGVMQAAPGLGAVLMAVVLLHRPPFRRAGRALLLTVTVFGLAMIAFALSRSFPLSVILLFVSGAADNVSAVIRAILIQVLVPPEMLGRVSAVNAIFIGSSNELGAFESGVAARLLGTVPSVVFGGIVTLLTVTVVAWRLEEVRTLREIEPA